MSRTRQVVEGLLYGRNNKDSDGSNGGASSPSSSFSVTDFLAGKHNASASTPIDAAAATTASTADGAVPLLQKAQRSVTAAAHPVFAALRSALTSRAALLLAGGSAAAALATLLYVASLRASAGATWAVLLEAASIKINSIGGGGAASADASENGATKKKRDKKAKRAAAFARNHMLRFYAEPQLYRASRKLAAAGAQEFSQQQALTINLAAGCFLRECDADAWRQMRARWITSLLVDAFERLPQWLRLALWERWLKKKSDAAAPSLQPAANSGHLSAPASALEQQQQLQLAASSPSSSLDYPRHAVIVVTEHAKLPSTYGVTRRSGHRVVEIGFPVLGEIALHTAVMVPSSSSTAAAAVVASPSHPQPQAALVHYFMRLVFLHGNHQRGLQNLVFSDCAAAGDATAGEDPQDIRVSAPSNLGITTVARYAASSTDDAAFPIVGVDSHAKLTLLPPLPRSGAKQSSTMMFPGAKKDPPDVLVQRTYFRRALSLTVFREAASGTADNGLGVQTASLLQKFDRTAPGDVVSSPTSSFAAAAAAAAGSASDGSSGGRNTVVLHSAFVVVSVMNVAARVTSCSLDRRVPVEPLACPEQTAAIVRKMNTGLAAAKQDAPSATTASLGGRGKKGGAGPASSAAAAAQDLSDGQQKQHFVFPLVYPNPELALHKLEKTTTEAATSAQAAMKNAAVNKKGKKGGDSAAAAGVGSIGGAAAAAPATVSSAAAQKEEERDAANDDDLTISFKRHTARTASSASPSSPARKAKQDETIFPLHIEFEFEHKRYIPRRMDEAAAAAAASQPAAAGTKAASDEDDDVDLDDDAVDFFPADQSAGGEDGGDGAAPSLSPKEQRQMQQMQNRELGLSVHLVWCALGEPASAIHVKRCVVKHPAAATTPAAGAAAAAADGRFCVRVLRESWNVMEVPLSFGASVH